MCTASALGCTRRFGVWRPADSSGYVRMPADRRFSASGQMPSSLASLGKPALVTNCFSKGSAAVPVAIKSH